MINKVKQRLFKCQDIDYQQFTQTLTPNKALILGVRMLEVRKISKEIIKDNPFNFLDENDFSLFELELIQAIVIGSIKDIDLALSYADKFMPIIDTWNTCDLFCGSFKLAKIHQNKVWHWLETYEKSNNPMTLRVIMVMMLIYFLNDDYIDKVLEKIDLIVYDDYYFRMGKAWLLAEMTVNYPAESLAYLQKPDLDLKVKKMAIRKIKDSFRVSNTVKNSL